MAAGRQRVEREQTESVEDVAFAKALDLDKAKIDLEKHQLANDNEKALIDLRKSYGQNMIRFLWVYFAVAMVTVILDGAGILKLPPEVIVALIGGTAVSVLGVVGTIVAGLFRVRSD